MFMRVLLWAILVGSVAMGIMGFQTGSVTNAIIGFTIFLFGGFLLYFVLKAFIHFGFIVVKVVLVLALIGLLILSGIKGCQLFVSSVKQAEKSAPATTAQEKNLSDIDPSQSFETEIPNPNSFWSKTKRFFTPSKKQEVKAKSAPVRETPKVKPLPPTISGTVNEVRSGYLFRIGTHFIKLYGIDTPDLNQTCYNRDGQKYQCGYQSKLMLERLILNKKVACQIVGGDYSGNYIATCKIKNTDVGVGLLTVGWAVADRRETDVYNPYEDKAHKARKGLWAGSFVAPWTARHQTNAVREEPRESGLWSRLFK